MSRFNYSKDELDINKVLKMNKDISISLLNDININELRLKADENIKKSVDLINLFGKEKNFTASLSTIKDNINLKNRPKNESFDKILEEAELHNKVTVTLEDIMTEEEINLSFDELEYINKEFSNKTSILNKKDLSFLFVATAINVVKTIIFQYISPKFDYGETFDSNDRLDHNDKSIKKDNKEANDRFRDMLLKKHKKGHWINIIYQSVPYDITRGSKDLNINMGGKYHRLHTLGHDPILGWIFGTANILTDCITFNDFVTNRISRVDPVTGSLKMTITSEVVPLTKMFYESYQTIRDDYLNLPAAVFAQAQHLKSDKYTKLGLPVPILSTINEEFASKLYKTNYDAICFSRDLKILGFSYIFSKIIDTTIGLIYSLFREDNESEELYEVRTKKILLISSSIASTSNLIKSVISKNPKSLDLGGLLNSVSNLFTDTKFIYKIKQEYIENEISNSLFKEIEEIDKLFDEI